VPDLQSSASKVPQLQDSRGRRHCNLWREQMNSGTIARTCATSAIAVALAVLMQFAANAQQPQPATGAATSASQQRTMPDQQVTITGCIQREADFRKARDAGRGGVAGTGVGAGNEFVLINASMAPSTGATGTAGTTGSTATAAYELTGANEGQAGQHVGKRVEIAGKLKAAETAAGQPTGGPTAGRPPEGIDVVGRDLMLRELEVVTVKDVPGTCPAM
jgi:hypothetical protein